MPLVIHLGCEWELRESGEVKISSGGSGNPGIWDGAGISSERLLNWDGLVNDLRCSYQWSGTKCNNPGLYWKPDRQPDTATGNKLHEFIKSKHIKKSRSLNHKI